MKSHWICTVFHFKNNEFYQSEDKAVWESRPNGTRVAFFDRGEKDGLWEFREYDPKRDDSLVGGDGRDNLILHRREMQDGRVDMLHHDTVIIVGWVDIANRIYNHGDGFHRETHPSVWRREKWSFYLR